ncbi:MAG: hypothetical protein AABZ73_03035 [Pseudomonadota bacterium]|uniref:hypothetical protein n=1 Tax=Sphingobium sp. TaxID=1912891 RepID=UPI002E1B94E7
MKSIKTAITIKCLAIALAASAFPAGALAVGATRGPVVSVRLDAGTNKLFVKLAFPLGGTPPSCATSPDYTGVLAITSEADKMIASLLISARQDGSIVYIRGKGVCTGAATVEDIDYIDATIG